MIFIIFFSPLAFTASFKGYSKIDESKSTSITNESIDKFIETKDDFLIAFSKHSSFYKFPKKKVDAYDFKAYLNKMIKTKKSVIVDIDPLTTQIYKISD